MKIPEYIYVHATSGLLRGVNVKQPTQVVPTAYKSPKPHSLSLKYKAKQKLNETQKPRKENPQKKPPRPPLTTRASSQTIYTPYRTIYLLQERETEKEQYDMAQSLELLLIQFLMPDNDARRQAEEQIKRLSKDPQVVPALVQHLRTAKTPNVRQLAAVLLRKKITGHWAKLSPQLKHLVKQSLIESITMEHRFPLSNLP